MADQRARTIGRRTVIGGAVGGLAAVAMKGLARPDSAAAANGDPVIIGASNFSSSVTVLAIGNGLRTRADLSGPLFGVAGTCFGNNGFGVYGSAQGIATKAVSGATTGDHTQVAVDGDATNGVGEGYGVRGRTQNGIGVYAEATGGYALQVAGRAVFSQRGLVTFSSGQASRTISATLPFLASSLVLATIQGNVAGTWVRSASINAAAQTFTIRLNKAAPSSLKVGWFIVN